MPCTFKLRRLAAKVKEGIRAAGGTPMELNTIAILVQALTIPVLVSSQ